MVLLGQQDARRPQHGAYAPFPGPNPKSWIWIDPTRTPISPEQYHLKLKKQPEVQMGERYKRILGALTEAELCRPALLQSRAKLRVAQETGEVRADMCGSGRDV